MVGFYIMRKIEMYLKEYLKQAPDINIKVLNKTEVIFKDESK